MKRIINDLLLYMRDNKDLINKDCSSWATAYILKDAIMSFFDCISEEPILIETLDEKIIEIDYIYDRELDSYFTDTDGYEYSLNYIKKII